VSFIVRFSLGGEKKNATLGKKVFFGMFLSFVAKSGEKFLATWQFLNRFSPPLFVGISTFYSISG
jgi:hypothetical protein